MEKLQKEKIAADLRQGRRIWMAPSGISLGDQSEKLVMSRIAAHIGRHDESRGCGIVARSKCWQGRKGRPSFRHIEAAIGCEPGQQDLFETGRCGFSARRDIHHIESTSRHPVQDTGSCNTKAPAKIPDTAQAPFRDAGTEQSAKRRGGDGIISRILELNGLTAAH